MDDKIFLITIKVVGNGYPCWRAPVDHWVIIYSRGSKIICLWGPKRETEYSINDQEMIDFLERGIGSHPRHWTVNEITEEAEFRRFQKIIKGAETMLKSTKVPSL